MQDWKLRAKLIGKFGLIVIPKTGLQRFLVGIPILFLFNSN